MSEPRAQRTLVKSPPELWAEISDVSTLARHLGEFGEIRITRLEAETTVVWEGDRARGTVNLEPSGWGTKVTLTAEAIAPEAAAEPGPAADREAVEEPVAAVEEPVAEVEEPVAEVEEPAVEAVEEPVAEAAVEEPEPADFTPALAAAPQKRSFFARLFGRRRPAPVVDEAPAEAAEPEPEPVAIAPEAPHTPTVAAPEPEEPVAAAEPEPDPDPIAEPVLEGEITAAAADAEQLDDERVEAVLVGVLDDLGSAHHRPFSRG